MDWFLYSTFLLSWSTQSALYNMPHSPTHKSTSKLKCNLNYIHTPMNVSEGNSELVSCPRTPGTQTGAARDRTTNLPISSWSAPPPEPQLWCNYLLVVINVLGQCTLTPVSSCSLSSGRSITLHTLLGTTQSLFKHRSVFLSHLFPRLAVAQAVEQVIHWSQG